LRISARKTAFLVRGDDRVGALTSVMGRLAKAKINIVSVQAVTAGKRRFGAILWVKPKEVAKASRALRAR
jgi:predicted amino acid-binding ACT domain protein